MSVYIVNSEEWYPITYYPELDELTDTFATFVNTKQGDHFGLSIPRKHWEAMGRPGKVYFEPKPWPDIATSTSAGDES